MLRARDEAVDQVRALQLGADAYPGKPFDVEELMARIEVQFRHPRQPAPTPRAETIVEAGGLLHTIAGVAKRLELA
jgi:DNA-binding response OmpR family regulator